MSIPERSIPPIHAHNGHMSFPLGKSSRKQRRLEHGKFYAGRLPVSLGTAPPTPTPGSNPCLRLQLNLVFLLKRLRHMDAGWLREVGWAGSGPARAKVSPPFVGKAKCAKFEGFRVWTMRYHIVGIR